ncbi:Sec-independent protein translocase protein TatB [Pararhodobacter oceanensis]|uniref:Sec-independent protein translocase protein TatB n=1 Tax=Pararhodobacter oceanensis TaxID=2172121 RepID=UPI003A93BAEF
MLDIGMSEMLIVGVVALIVVGPKDLPKMFHTVGEVVGKARGMAREFQSAMNAAAKEAGVGDLSKDLRNLKSGRALKDAVGFDDIDKEMRAIERDMDDMSKDLNTKVLPDDDKRADVPHIEASDDEAEALDAEIGADELEAASHDAELARRNEVMTQVEAARLAKVKKSDEARHKAAMIRSKKDAKIDAMAASKSRAGDAPATPSSPPSSPASNTEASAPAPRPDTDET